MLAKSSASFSHLRNGISPYAGTGSHWCPGMYQLDPRSAMIPAAMQDSWWYIFVEIASRLQTQLRRCCMPRGQRMRRKGPEPSPTEARVGLVTDRIRTARPSEFCQMTSSIQDVPGMDTSSGYFIVWFQTKVSCLRGDAACPETGGFAEGALNLFNSDQGSPRDGHGPRCASI